MVLIDMNYDRPIQQSLDKKRGGRYQGDVQNSKVEKRLTLTCKTQKTTKREMSPQNIT